jgi:AbrB family looped-hinge helix DNA binding protein
MAFIKVLPSGQVTLPAELRRRFKLDDGTYLDATAVEGGILLRPVEVDGRRKAWSQVMAVVEEEKWSGGEPPPSPDQEEEQIYELIADFRKTNLTR